MKVFYPTTEVAKRLGVSGNTIRMMCLRGELPYIKLKVGGRFRYFIPTKEMDDIIEAASRPAKPGRPTKIYSIVRG